MSSELNLLAAFIKIHSVQYNVFNLATKSQIDLSKYMYDSEFIEQFIFSHIMFISSQEYDSKQISFRNYLEKNFRGIGKEFGYEEEVGEIIELVFSKYEESASKELIWRLIYLVSFFYSSSYPQGKVPRRTEEKVKILIKSDLILEDNKISNDAFFSTILQNKKLAFYHILLISDLVRSLPNSRVKVEEILHKAIIKPHKDTFKIVISDEDGIEFPNKRLPTIKSPFNATPVARDVKKLSLHIPRTINSEKTISWEPHESPVTYRTIKFDIHEESIQNNKRLTECHEEQNISIVSNYSTNYMTFQNHADSADEKDENFNKCSHYHHTEIPKLKFLDSDDQFAGGFSPLKLRETSQRYEKVIRSGECKNCQQLVEAIKELRARFNQIEVELIEDKEALIRSEEKLSTYKKKIEMESAKVKLGIEKALLDSKKELEAKSKQIKYLSKDIGELKEQLSKFQNIQEDYIALLKDNEEYKKMIARKSVLITSRILQVNSPPKLSEREKSNNYFKIKEIGLELVSSSKYLCRNNNQENAMLLNDQLINSFKIQSKKLSQIEREMEEMEDEKIGLLEEILSQKKLIKGLTERKSNLSFCLIVIGTIVFFYLFCRF